MRFSGRGRSRALMTGLRGSVAAASAVDSALCTKAAEGPTPLGTWTIRCECINIIVAEGCAKDQGRL